MTDETTTRRAPTLADLRARRDEILALAERYGASNVRVFGSVARGDATPDSDIDLLVNFRETASLLEVSAFWQEVQTLLNAAVDVVEDHTGLRERLRKRIMREAVPL